MKITRQLEYRVVCYPSQYYPLITLSNEDRTKLACQQIIKEIKRHVENVDSIEMQWETEEICSHCKKSWEVYDDGEPACCTPAQDEWAQQTTRKETP